MSEQVSMSSDAIKYIAEWIIDEVDDYHGKSLHIPKMDSLDDYDESTLAKAIMLAMDAWNGGARNDVDYRT